MNVVSRIKRANYQVGSGVVLAALEDVLGEALDQDLVCLVIWTHTSNVRWEQRGAFRHDCELQRTQKMTFNSLRNGQKVLPDRFDEVFQVFQVFQVFHEFFVSLPN